MFETSGCSLGLVVHCSMMNYKFNERFSFFNKYENIVNIFNISQQGQTLIVFKKLFFLEINGLLMPKNTQIVIKSYKRSDY